MTELSALESAWRGAGGRSFEQVKTRWAQDQRVMSTALAETATAIRGSAAGYHASDSEAAARVATSHRDITLPL